MGLEHIFSESNMTEYAGACLDLAMKIPEQKGFDTLLIPSRGAVPFFLGMAYALKKFDWSDDHRRFREELGIHSLIEPLLPKDCGLKVGASKGKIKTLLIPFTADLNIKSKNEQEMIEITRETRYYWSRVATSFMKEPRIREKDPYFASFVDGILKNIEGRKKLISSYCRFPRVKNFAIIDTVISGRASNDILKAFDKIAETHNNGIEGIINASEEMPVPYAFLVVDEGGRKLRRKFLTYINRKKAVGQVKTYPINRIVSEDEGASLEGVAAVVYPGLMESSKDLVRYVNDHTEPFFIGAGSWHIVPNDNYLNNFARFMDLVYSSIDFKYAKDFGDGMGRAKEIFEEKRKEFVKYAKKQKILARHDCDPAILNLNPNYAIDRFYETRSHVLHIDFDGQATQDIISEIIRSVNKGENCLEYRYKR